MCSVQTAEIGGGGNQRRDGRRTDAVSVAGRVSPGREGGDWPQGIKYNPCVWGRGQAVRRMAEVKQDWQRQRRQGQPDD